MIKIYGIKNCDTVKKALKQLDEQKIVYAWVDLKTVILTDDTIARWLDLCPDTLINKRSTTYRNLKNDWLAANSMQEKIKLIQDNQTLIKRPVVEKSDGGIIVGYNNEIYKDLSA